MRRKYVVKNVGDKLAAQKLNGMISAARRVQLTAENYEGLLDLVGGGYGSTTNEVANALIMLCLEERKAREERKAAYESKS